MPRTRLHPTAAPRCDRPRGSRRPLMWQALQLLEGPEMTRRILIDNQSYAASWDAAASVFRNAVTQEKWQAAAQAVRTPLVR
jgi:hypothetical protein